MPEVEKIEKEEAPQPKAEKPKDKIEKPEEGKSGKGKPEDRLAEDKEKKDQSEPRKGGLKIKLAIPPIVKTIGIIVVGFVVLVVASFFLTSKVIKPFMVSQLKSSAAKKAKAKAVVKPKAPVANEVKEVFMVEDMVVNPAETNGTRFLNTTIGLGVGDLLAKQTLEEKAPQVRDALISILTTKTIPELVQPDGKKILRNEIIKKVDRIIAPYQVLEVYFVAFVLQ
jgi:flagellar FliL protein